VRVVTSYKLQESTERMILASTIGKKEDSNFGDLPDNQVVSGKIRVIKGHSGLFLL